MRRVAFILADWALLLAAAGIAVNLVWHGLAAVVRRVTA